ncbi:MAG: cell division protein FtsL [Deltaproteobacteria bacterium GWC2_56_8]|nr:MAG: cell division protein FtsL [Deltaproteobacteria bacterium GWB2_55_19]OGP38429.1 MAG: cell division protein FtsL [Deltaproteobacteria bacterium GWC2_56_8]HAO94047.1 cell division protein FtsL [Deltaproteobacteria bacterium]
MSETAVARKMSMQGVLTGQDVKVRRDLRDMSFLYLSILISFALIAVASAFVWSRLMVVNLGYEISKANSARGSLTEQNKRLRVEYMKLKSPERIEKIASSELGLIHPKGEQIVNVR